MAVDTAILNTVAGRGQFSSAFLNERLMSDLRPTLFLAAALEPARRQYLRSCTASRGSSRTFMGEEAAGIDAARIAWSRIAAGQSDIALVGGSL